MSLYQSHYGQQYPPSFAQPSYHGYQQPQYPPPPAFPPPPVYHVDPTTFRRDFTNRLTELTVNSRPIIQSLSMLAQDFTRFSDIVAQCLEAHIRRVPPWMKLPAFYLLDAISKNVYDPYARLFAAFVIPLFLESYNQVDPPTRSKMEEMLLTWRTGSPAGKELFGVAPQIAIERGVWGSGSGTSNNNGSSFTSTSLTKAQVLSELEFTLGQKERAVQTNPYDDASRNHISILHQLRKLVEAGVSQEELQQILTQLRNLMRTVAPPPPPPANAASTPSWSAPQSYPPSSQMSSLPQAATYGRPPPQSYASQSFGDIKIEGSNSAATLATPMTNADAVAPVPSVNSIQNLLSTLVKAGVVQANVTPPEAGPSQQDASNIKPEDIDLAKESARSYRKTVLTQKIKLTTSDITKKRLDIVSLLYDRLPSQCKQCGLRFAGFALGKKALQDHLDVHFRQNRKANQNVGRGHSRSWFVSIDDWVSDTSGDIKGKGLEDGTRPLNSKAAAVAEAAKREADLRSQYVVVPPGDEAKTISCPICKDSLKSEFLEDDEDWVWKNAVLKDGKVYHATCHAEAMASTSSLAAKLRSDLAGRSRSATPDSSSVLRSTPPRAAGSSLKHDVRNSKSPTPDSMNNALKRKADATAATKGDLEGTPPTKKVALSA